MKQQECENRFSPERRVFDRHLNGVKPIEESPGRQLKRFKISLKATQPGCGKQQNRKRFIEV
jgi:hypothetical protein